MIEKKEKTTNQLNQTIVKLTGQRKFGFPLGFNFNIKKLTQIEELEELHIMLQLMHHRTPSNLESAISKTNNQINERIEEKESMGSV